MPRVPLSSPAVSGPPGNLPDAAREARSAAAVGEAIAEAGRTIGELGRQQNAARQQAALTTTIGRFAADLPDIERQAEEGPPDQHAATYESLFDQRMEKALEETSFFDKQLIGAKLAEIRASQVPSQRRIGIQREVAAGKATIEDETLPSFRKAIGGAHSVLLKEQLEDQARLFIRTTSYLTEDQKADLDLKFMTAVTTDMLEQGLTDNPGALAIALEDRNFASQLNPTDREIWKRKAEDRHATLESRDYRDERRARADSKERNKALGSEAYSTLLRMNVDFMQGKDGARLPTPDEVLAYSDVMTPTLLKAAMKLTQPAEDKKPIDVLAVGAAQELVDRDDLTPTQKLEAIQKDPGLRSQDKGPLLERLKLGPRSPLVVRHAAALRREMTARPEGGVTTFLQTAPAVLQAAANAADDEFNARIQKRFQQGLPLDEASVLQIRREVRELHALHDMNEFGDVKPIALPRGMKEEPRADQLDALKERLAQLGRTADPLTGVSPLDESGNEQETLEAWIKYYAPSSNAKPATAQKAPAPPGRLGQRPEGQ